MSESSRSLCSKIADRPDNESIGQLTHLLNDDRSVDHGEIFDRCGKYLSGINLENCVEILLAKGDKDLLEKYLRLVDDIPEKQFILILNFSVNFLDILLDKRYDYWSLTHAMKVHLNSSLAVELADQLCQIFVEKNDRFTAALLDWFCALIDAHYSAFVLAKWKNLPLLEQSIQQRLNTFDQLQSIRKISPPASASASASSTSTSTSTSTTSTSKRNDLYVLQRIHFK